ncbi:neuronal acetylcholine receptor subunit alpha-10 [Neopelma chrysocephalum]|uniref:neuronal acetylcholine receptor subunit alpha-10 n=1 Tax=Neopelma chrysocephalum TaxID=114329 RepID=UPI000FCD41C6|nr:neuronal acetylcholine receptor subunit alpha-10 [Neopelma chrysocephalum]
MNNSPPGNKTSGLKTARHLLPGPGAGNVPGGAGEPGALGLLRLCLCLCLAGVLLAPGCRGAQGRFAYKLLHELFANYSSALRPVEDTDRALNVTLQVTLSQIIDMDERNQVLTSYLWVRQAWLDAHLTWDKDDYGGIDSIRIPSSYVWRPDIILYNNADEHFGGSMETNVVLRSDGLIMWDSPAITKSSCKVDVSYFPFDGQRCRLTFGSWTYNGNQIDLRNRLDSGDLTDFVENVEWEVLGMPATRNVVTYGCCSEPYPDVTYTLLLRRRASFYIFNLLLPCIMVSFLAPLGFYLPADSGEKVSLGVTVLLALTVFQLLVAESMPPSESVPLIGKYYIATMTMITASTALTIFIMNIHHCGPGARPVPPWARRLILHHMARLCCVHEVGESCKSPPRAPGGRGNGGDGAGGPWESPGQGEVGAEAGGCPRGRCPCHHDALLRNVGYIAGCFRRHRANQRRAGDWKRVAKVTDRFFMWIFFLMVFLMSVLVLGNAA